jgi:hypothetical protein
MSILIKLAYKATSGCSRVAYILRLKEMGPFHASSAHFLSLAFPQPTKYDRRRILTKKRGLL